MKNYFNIIVIAAILLLLFPFLGFPELWENIYVSILAFIIGYTAMLLRHKVVIRFELDEETSLNEYVKELKARFKNSSEISDTTDKETGISDIQKN